MEWTPSFIRAVPDAPDPEMPKTATSDRDYLSTLLANVDSIFAGSYRQKKRGDRPVMLISVHQDGLMPRPLSPAEEQEWLLEKDVVQISLKHGAQVYPDHDLTIRESLLAEEITISRLEKHEPIPPERVVITTEDRSFFIGRARLLGEILLARRKLERFRGPGLLRVLHPLECFIKKLGMIKMLADQVSSEKRANAANFKL